MDLSKYHKVYGVRRISTGELIKRSPRRPFWERKGDAQSAKLSHLKESSWAADRNEDKARELTDLEIIECVVVPVRAINGLDIYPQMKKYAKPQPSTN